MSIEIETQEQREARHNTGNYLPEFLRENARAEEIAKKAGYNSDGSVQKCARDLEKSWDLSRGEAKILINGKKVRNDIVHPSNINNCGNTMSVSESSYKELRNVVDKVQDIVENGSVTFF